MGSAKMFNFKALQAILAKKIDRYARLHLPGNVSRFVVKCGQVHELCAEIFFKKENGVSGGIRHMKE